MINSHLKGPRHEYSHLDGQIPFHPPITRVKCHVSAASKTLTNSQNDNPETTYSRTSPIGWAVSGVEMIELLHKNINGDEKCQNKGLCDIWKDEMKRNFNDLQVFSYWFVSRIAWVKNSFFYRFLYNRNKTKPKHKNPHFRACGLPRRILLSALLSPLWRETHSNELKCSAASQKNVGQEIVRAQLLIYFPGKGCYVNKVSLSVSVTHISAITSLQRLFNCHTLTRKMDGFGILITQPGPWLPWLPASRDALCKRDRCQTRTTLPIS